MRTIELTDWESGLLRIAFERFQRSVDDDEGRPWARSHYEREVKEKLQQLATKLDGPTGLQTLA